MSENVKNTQNQTDIFWMWKKETTLVEFYRCLFLPNQTNHTSKAFALQLHWNIYIRIAFHWIDLRKLFRLGALWIRIEWKNNETTANAYNGKTYKLFHKIDKKQYNWQCRWFNGSLTEMAWLRKIKGGVKRLVDCIQMHVVKY